MTNQKITLEETISKQNNIAISVVDLVSCEHKKVDNNLVPLLHGINFQIEKNDVLGISGNNNNDVLLLCEILGNIRPYYKGFVKLSELGTKRKKKEIVEKIYYIDTHEMLYSQMTVLEQMLFATEKQTTEKNPIIRQKKMLDLLVANGLKTIALTRISELSAAMRISVSLFLASLSKSETIVMNLLDYTFSQNEIEVLVGVMKYVKNIGKTCIIATMQPKLIGMTCDNVLFLYNGSCEYYGPVSELCLKWDRVVCIIKGKQLEKIKKVIEDSIKYYKGNIENEELYIRNHSEEPNNQKQIIHVLEENEIVPDFIKFNMGRVENSFRELLVKYDI